VGLNFNTSPLSFFPPHKSTLFIAIAVKLGFFPFLQTARIFVNGILFYFFSIFAYCQKRDVEYEEKLLVYTHTHMFV